MSAMPRPRPPHLHRQVTQHGRTVWYVRQGKGQRIRIRAAFGTAEFDAEYQAALAGERLPKQKHAAGTFGWLVNLYRQSPAFTTQLSKSTRQGRDNILIGVLKTSADASLSKVNRASVQNGVNLRAHTPAQARAFLAAMRHLFTWAVATNTVKLNPTIGVQGVKEPKGKPKEGHPVWTEDDIVRFETRFPRGTRERVMLDVLLYTGLRIGDASKVGKQHVRDGVITIDTEKTGTRVTIPMLPDLAETIEAGPTGDLAWIATHDGRPFHKVALSNAFRRACKAAGVNKRAHGLRKAAATRAATRGATVAQLEAIFGWSGGGMAALYTRNADRGRLAASAMSTLSRKGA